MDSQDKKKKPTIIRYFNRWFMTGILVSVPLILTAFIVIWTVELFDRLIIDPLTPEILPRKIPGLGLVISIVFMVVLGFLASNFLGRFFVRVGNYILYKIPVVGVIYSTLQQIFDTVLATNSRAFKDVVLVEYPKRDSWVLAFITSKSEGELQGEFPEPMVNVFVPTTPNPTSGFLLIVPKSSTIALKMSTEEAMKIIISGGIVTNNTKDANTQKKN